MRTCVVLVDGQHYPAVVERTLASLRAQGDVPRAAVFLGGSEKTETPPDLGIPVEIGAADALRRALAAHPCDVVIDLSDEPVLDNRRRFELIAVALMSGVGYEGAGYRLSPPPRPPLTSLPTAEVTGTGKRTGKTAVAIELARYWASQGRRPCIVTMGRGGPAEPVLLRAGTFTPTPDGLLALAEAGLHAASDYIEDAVFAGVDTVGTFRCGAGLTGQTDWHNFAAGMDVAGSTSADMLILEGSGTALPPCAVDSSLLVVSPDIAAEYLAGYLGPYRLALADAVVVVGGSGVFAAAGRLLPVIRSVRPDLPVFVGAYVPEPSLPVSGRRVLAATTAPLGAADDISAQLRTMGAHAVEVVHTLSDRAALRRDLTDAEARGAVDVVLVEVKAAAIDIVVPWARSLDLEVGFLHNRVDVAGGVEEMATLMNGG